MILRERGRRGREKDRLESKTSISGLLHASYRDRACTCPDWNQTGNFLVHRTMPTGWATPAWAQKFFVFKKSGVTFSLVKTLGNCSFGKVCRVSYLCISVFPQISIMNDILLWTQEKNSFKLWWSKKYVDNVFLPLEIILIWMCHHSMSHVASISTFKILYICYDCHNILPCAGPEFSHPTAANLDIFHV